MDRPIEVQEQQVMITYYFYFIHPVVMTFISTSTKHSSNYTKLYKY